MSTELDPIVGKWYEDVERDQQFIVVSIDEDNGVVEVQDFEGEVDEIDLDDWYAMDLEITEAPEGWSRSIDEPDDDDFEDEDDDDDDWDDKPKRSRGKENKSWDDSDDDNDDDDDFDEEPEEDDDW